MKILFGIQGTGYGHVVRSQELVRELFEPRVGHSHSIGYHQLREALVQGAGVSRNPGAQIVVLPTTSSIAPGNPGEAAANQRLAYLTARRR